MATLSSGMVKVAQPQVTSKAPGSILFKGYGSIVAVLNVISRLVALGYVCQFGTTQTDNYLVILYSIPNPPSLQTWNENIAPLLGYVAYSDYNCGYVLSS